MGVFPFQMLMMALNVASLHCLVYAMQCEVVEPVEKNWHSLDVQRALALSEALGHVFCG